MYPEAEEEIKKVALKDVLSSLYEHVRTCKVCHTYLDAILEHGVKYKARFPQSSISCDEQKAAVT
jgi:hypothetical protein